MQVNSYIYQSPSSSSVQFGRPDPSAPKSSNNSNAAELNSNTNESSQNAQIFLSSQKSEVTPSVDKGNSLDIYA